MGECEASIDDLGGREGGGRRTLENTDGGGKVVDPPSSLEGSSEDGGGGDEIVGEGVVEVALRKKAHDDQPMFPSFENSTEIAELAPHQPPH